MKRFSFTSFSFKGMGLVAQLGLKTMFNIHDCEAITTSILSLDIKYPEMDAQKLAAIEAAKKKLEAEGTS